MRSEQIGKAIFLEWITIAWMILEAVVAIASGLASGHLSLIAFGADSGIELLSAVVLLWRLGSERKAGGSFSDSAEQVASRISAILLFLLGAFVAASSFWGLWHRVASETTWPGLIVTALAIPTMYVLAKAKLRLADQLGSSSLQADAMESITCGYLSVVVLLGLLIQLAVGVWWMDSIASLLIVYFLIREGHEAWRGEKCCGCAD